MILLLLQLEALLVDNQSHCLQVHIAPLRIVEGVAVFNVFYDAKRCILHPGCVAGATGHLQTRRTLSTSCCCCCLCHCCCRCCFLKLRGRISFTVAAQQQQVASGQPAAAAAVQPTEWFQKTITLPQHKRGCHVITRKLLAELPEVSEFEVGLANLFSKLPS